MNQILLSSVLWGCGDRQICRAFILPKRDPCTEKGVAEAASPCPLGCRWPQCAGSWWGRPRVAPELGFLWKGCWPGRYQFWGPSRLCCKLLGDLRWDPPLLQAQPPVCNQRRLVWR